MSDTTTSTLTELANFIAKSPLAAQDDLARRKAVNAMAVNLIPPPPVQIRVTDLMATVLALSARTRRMVQPRTEIDLDVFTPSSRRAVRLFLGRSID